MRIPVKRTFTIVSGWNQRLRRIAWFEILTGEGEREVYWAIEEPLGFYGFPRKAIPGIPLDPVIALHYGPPRRR